MSDPGAQETFEVPGLGKVIREKRFGWYESNAVRVPILGQVCRFFLEGYAEDDGKADFATAISNLLHLDETALRGADESLFRYYKDYEEWWVERGEAPLCNAEEVWGQVTLGHELAVARRPYGDHAIYISIECECAWEEEHGLQLVFKNGLRLNKLGSYDGHVTNSDAYTDPILEDVIYHPLT